MKIASTLIPTIALYLWEFRGYADRGRICLASDAIACSSSLRLTNRQDSSILEPATKDQEGGEPEVMEMFYPSITARTILPLWYA
ncbi:MAG: hypothetical protein KME25_31565 [Symplocastrum torsivum CPER-KK1]|uniref:Uncharacterized protein n=1 Tax=Symplocastrum torsivum CPER-KK1 TaxID=450513 RepID=A0A951UCY2_9CYAN|nr:hypothetical protein [Symplocastrum torsivum CPER-KK1]